MACHHNSHHQPCCRRCCCSSSCCQPIPHPAIHSATTTAATDPLLQAIASHLLQPPPAAPPQTTAYHLYNQAYPKPQHHHHPQQQQRQKLHKYQQQIHQPQAQSLIESLLSRIAALESALPHLSPPPPPAATPEPPPPPPPRRTQPAPPPPPANPRLSIRDLAARTIQAHFRLYLVRRSQALRHLKHLAAIKSSLSDQSRLNPKALSQQASDLLFQLDSIQSTDPMIREGKRSIGRELVQLLEFADGLSAKRHELFAESTEIPHKGIDPLPFPGVGVLAGASTIYGEDDEQSDAGSPGVRVFSSKPGKRVNFTEDGKASKVSTTTGSPFASVNTEWGSSGGDGGSRHTSDDERSPRSRQKPGTIRPVANGSPSGQKGGSRLLGLSAPMPVLMEPRIGDSKKKKKKDSVVI